MNRRFFQKLCVFMGLLLASSLAAADPVSIIGAISSALATQIGGVALGTWLAAGVSLVSGLAASSQAKRRARQEAARKFAQDVANLRDRTATLVSSEAPWPTIYGSPARVGGAIVGVLTSGQTAELKHVVIVFAAHECEAIDAIYIDGEHIGDLAPGGWSTAPEFQLPPLITGWPSQGPAVNVQIHTSPGGVDWADGYLKSSVDAVFPGRNLWTDNHRLSGCTYAVVTLNLFLERFQGGLPEITARVRGKKVYDYRTGQTTYSRNPALCLADFLRSEAGYLASHEQIDQNAVIAAANACDQQVYGGEADGDRENYGGSRALYVCDGRFLSDQDRESTRQQLEDSMAGFSLESGGVWRIQAGAWSTPVISLGDADMLEPTMVLQTANPGTARLNGMRGTYVNAARNGTSEDFRPYQNPTFRGLDAKDKYGDMPLSFTASHVRCHQIARTKVEQSRGGFVLRIHPKMAAWHLQPGDRIVLSSALYGFANKTFRVQEWSYSQQAALALQVIEDVPAYYDLADEVQADAAPNTNLPSPFLAPSPPLDVNAESGPAQMVQQDGVLVVRARVSWVTSTEPVVLRGGAVRVQWRLLETDQSWQSQDLPGDAAETFLMGLSVGGTYQIRVRFMTAYAVSSWSLVQHVVKGKVQPPGAVTGLQLAVESDGVYARWQQPEGLDLLDWNMTELRVGDAWESGVDVFSGRATVANLGWFKKGVSRVWASHGDTVGRWSAPISATVDILPPAQPVVSGEAWRDQVELQWPVCQTTQPLRGYEVRVGNVFDDAQVLTVADALGYKYTQTVPGTYLYWVTAVDAAGNRGASGYKMLVTLPGIDEAIAEINQGLGNVAQDIIDLDHRVDAEASRLTTSISSVASNLQTESNNRAIAVAGVTSSLSTEVSARISNVASLSTSTQALAAGLQAQVNTLNGQVGDIVGADVWSSSMTYPKNDLVVYEGALYRSLQPQNVGRNPATSATWWERIGNYASLSEALSATAAQSASNDARITSAEGAITAQASQVNALGTRLSTAEGGINANTGAIQGLQTSVSEIDGDLTALSSHQTSLGAVLLGTDAPADRLADVVGPSMSLDFDAQAYATWQKLTLADLGSGLLKDQADATAAATSSLDARVTATEGQITSQSAALTQLTNTVNDPATGLPGKASAGALSALTTRVSTAEGTLSSQGTSITTLSTSLSGLTVGGRNFVRNSATLEVPGYSGSTWTHTSGVAVTEWGATDARTSVSSGGTATLKGFFSATGAPAQAEPHPYVVSMWVRNNGVAFILGANRGSVAQLVPAGFNGRVVLKTPAGATGLAQILFQAVAAADVLNVTYWHPKIELGTVVSDWSPAPEDVNAAIGAKADASAVTALDTRVTTAESRITSQGQSITTLTNTVNDPTNGLPSKASNTSVNALSSRVSTAEGQITAQGSSITQLQSSVSNSAVGFIETWDGATPLSQWTNYSGAGEATIVANPDASGPGGKLLRVGNASGNDQWWGIHARTIPVRDAETYRVTARVRRVSGTGTAYLGVAGVASDGTTFVNNVGANSFSNQCYTNWLSPAADGTWYTLTGYVRRGGSGTIFNTSTLNSPMGLHANVSYVRPLVIVGYQGQAGVWEVSSVTLEPVGEAAAVSAAKADATAVSALTTQVNSIDGNLTALTNAHTALAGEVRDPSTGLTATRAQVASDLSTLTTAQKAQATQTQSLGALLTGQSAPASALTEVIGPSMSLDFDAASTLYQVWEPLSLQTVGGVLGGERDARATAVNSLDTRVTAAEGTITSQGTALTQLSTTVGGKADASALNALTTRVTAAEGSLTTQGQSITSLNASLSTTATTANRADALTGVIDTRNDNRAPDWYWTNYPRRTLTELKTRTVVGAPSGGAMGYMTTVVPWADASGGAITQMFRTSDDTTRFTRNSQGSGAAATWTAWKNDVADLAALKADASALTALTTRVTAAEGSITSQASQQTALSAKLDSTRDSDSLVPDYLLANAAEWESHYGTALAPYFKTTTTGKIGPNIVEKTAANTANFWNYSRVALPNTRAYRVEMWVRRSADSTGQNRITYRYVDPTGAAAPSPGYGSTDVTVPADGNWYKVSATIDASAGATVNANTVPRLRFGFALGHTGTAGWVQMQGFRVTAVLSTGDVDSSIATAAALSTTNATVTSQGGQITAQGQTISQLSTSVAGNSASITAQQSALAMLDGKVAASYTLNVTAGNKVAGFRVGADGATSNFTILADKFAFVQPDGNGALKYPFTVGSIAGVSSVGINGNVFIDGTVKTRHVDAEQIIGTHIKAGEIDTAHLKAGSITADKINVGLGGNLVPDAGFMPGNAGLRLELGFLAQGWGSYHTDDYGYVYGINLGGDGAHPAGGNTQGIYQPNDWANSIQDGSKVAQIHTSRFAIVGGERYEYSVYSGAQRCRNDVGIEFRDASGTVVGWAGGGPGQTNDNEMGGGSSLSGYKRIGGFVTAPANAATALMIFRKWPTKTGNASSWLFITQPYFGRAAPSQTVFSPWSAGGLGVQISPAGITTPSIEAISGVMGNLHSGSVRGGAFTGYDWPPNGAGGYYLGPQGLLLGNGNSGRFFQVEENGNVHAPKFSIINGKLTISEVDVIDTLNLRNGAVTQAIQRKLGMAVDSSNYYVPCDLSFTVPNGQTWDSINIVSWGRGGLGSNGYGANFTLTGGETLYLDALPMPGGGYRTPPVSNISITSHGAGNHTIAANGPAATTLVCFLRKR